MSSKKNKKGQETSSVDKMWVFFVSHPKKNADLQRQNTENVNCNTCTLYFYKNQENNTKISVDLV